MFAKLLLLFTVVPTLELVLLLQAAKWKGLWWTVGLILLTGIVGSALARSQGLAVMRATQAEMARGQVPSHGLLEGMLLFAAGALLVTPGFLTDICGLLCLVPWTRRRFMAYLRRRAQQWVESGNVQVAFHREGVDRHS